MNVTKDAAVELSKGMSVVGTQIGLGATMVGISTAIGKAIAKSGMPPLQKAAIIAGGAVIGGLTHSKMSLMNKNAIIEENIKNGNFTSSGHISSSVTKLISDNTHTSPLEDLLSNLELTFYVCISLILLLIIQIIFKIHLKDSIKFNMSILSNNTNNTIEFFINKIILLNKKMSIIYI
jgi:hypothetical protein